MAKFTQIRFDSHKYVSTKLKASSDFENQTATHFRLDTVSLKSILGKSFNQPSEMHFQRNTTIETFIMPPVECRIHCRHENFFTHSDL